MATTLTITLNDNGSISVNGPLTNKILCWGLLTAAEDVIRTYDAKDEKRIVVPDFLTPSDISSRPNPSPGMVAKFPVPEEV